MLKKNLITSAVLGLVASISYATEITINMDLDGYSEWNPKYENFEAEITSLVGNGGVVSETFGLSIKNTKKGGEILKISEKDTASLGVVNGYDIWYSQLKKISIESTAEKSVGVWVDGAVAMLTLSTETEIKAPVVLKGNGLVALTNAQGSSKFHVKFQVFLTSQERIVPNFQF